MKKRNKKSRLSEFIRYTRGEMTKREENAFQRELQRDPFAEEAEEGLSEISPEEAVSDLNILERRLKTRISGSQRKIYYSIAASVAVLMIISSVFIIINKSKPASELSGNVAVQSPVEVPASEVITEQPETSTRDLITEPEKRAVVPPEPIVVQEITDEVREEPQMAAGGVRSENTVLPAAQEPSLFAAEEEIAAAPSAVMKKKYLTAVSGTVISSEDNLPVPGALISLKGTNTRVITDTDGKFSIPVADTVSPTLVASFIGMESMEFRAKEDTDIKISLAPTAMALSEVVVVGYAEEAKSEDISYSSAQPVTGSNEFDKYIEENIQNPASLPSGQRAVVVLSFLVKTNGTIDSMKVVRTPGPEFSDEAIRLIREGPSWKPAEENGKAIDDEVRIRIVFK